MNKTYTYGFTQKNKTNDSCLLRKTQGNFGWKTQWKNRGSQKNEFPSNHSKPNKKRSTLQSTEGLSEKDCNQEIRSFIKKMKNNIQLHKAPFQQPQINIKPLSSRSESSIAKTNTNRKAYSEYGNERSSHQTIYDQDCGESLSLEQLDKKISEVVKHRLMFRNKNRSQIFHRLMGNESEFDKDLQKLTKQVKQICPIYQDSQNQVSQSIKQISRKINVIEKILASSFTQSQIFKKYYLSKCSTRKTQATLQNTIKHPLPQNRGYASSLGSKTQVQSQTTNMATYRKPPRHSYNQFQLPKDSYVMNRFSVPRSSYQHDYYFKGSVPLFKTQTEHLKSNNPFDVTKKINLGFKKTEYQQQFEEKKVVIVDSWSLDCRQNKFKNLKISFMPKKHQGKSKTLLQSTKDKQPKNKPISNCQKVVVMPNSQTDNICFSNVNKQRNQYKNTEARSIFKGFPCTIESVMKQRNIQKLKYEYRVQCKC